jgi:hypothetical protein
VAQHGAVGLCGVLAAAERIEQQARAAQLERHRLRAVRLVLRGARAQARLQLLVTAGALEQRLDAVGHLLRRGLLALQTLERVDRDAEVADLLLHGRDLGDAEALPLRVLQLGDAPERAHELGRRAARALEPGQRLQGLEVARVERERALVGALRVVAPLAPQVDAGDAAAVRGLLGRAEQRVEHLERRAQLGLAAERLVHARERAQRLRLLGREHHPALDPGQRAVGRALLRVGGLDLAHEQAEAAAVAGRARLALELLER